MNKILSRVRTILLINRQKHVYKTYFNNRNETKLLDDIDCGRDIYDFIDSEKTLLCNISPREIIAGNKYPSTKNLNIVCVRIGIDDVFNQMAIKSHKPIKSNLESFLSVRESIAHQDPPDLTYDDVVRNFEYVLEFMMYFEQVLYEHVSNVSGDEFWPK